MMKSINTLSGTLLVLALVHPSQATADEAWQSQLYVGAGLGISRLEPDSNGTIFDVEDKNSSGYKLTLGYDWSERISTEAYYADLGEAKMSPHGKVEYQDLGISGLYHFFQQEMPHRGLEAFAKVGLGYMKNDSDLNYEREHDGHLMFGLGAGYGFENGLMLRADLDLFDEDSQFLSINLIKGFGGSKPAPVKETVTDGVSVVELPRYAAPVAAPVFADKDIDGVADSQDVCPGTLTGAVVDPRGCASSWILQGVRFEHDRDILTTDSKVILDQVASQLIAQKTERRIQIMGHTDASGPTSYNRQLSQQRAEAVLNYLVSKGVDSAKLSAVGRGESQPIADNATAEGRSKNRRVELHWE